MRSILQSKRLNRFIGVSIFVAVTMVGICLPLYAFADSFALTCVQIIHGKAAEKEATISAYFDERTQKYISIVWGKQNFQSDEFQTVVHRTYETSSATKPTVDTAAFDRYLEEVSPLIHLANKYFELRRGWGNQNTEVQGENPFSKKNLKVAKDYLTSSSYVMVHDKAGRLLGGMRNIQLRDQDKSILPEEKFLHLTVPQMGLARTVPGVSWKNEAGAFVIEEDLPPEIHQKIRLEIWTNLYRFIFSKGSVRENYYDQAVHTYGDRKSVLMYKMSGFQKLRIYKHEGKWVDYSKLPEKEVPAIMIDGEPWWPLVLLPEDAVALNEKFSTSSRAQVEPSWLQNRRHSMSEVDISTLQMGALFPHLLEDLDSANHERFLSALTGLATIIESAAEHMSVAGAVNSDRAINDRAVQEVIKIRDQLFQLTMKLSAQLPTMNQEQRDATASFAGQILQLKEKASDFMFTSEFLEKVVFPFITAADTHNAFKIMHDMNMARKPKRWIQEAALVFDYSMDSEDEFAHDTKVAEAQLNKRLQDAGYSATQIDDVVSYVQKALFEPHRVLGDINTNYRIDTQLSLHATVGLINLTRSKPENVSLFIKLAAVRQYLQDRSAKP